MDTGFDRSLQHQEDLVGAEQVMSVYQGFSTEIFVEGRKHFFFSKGNYFMEVKHQNHHMNLPNIRFLFELINYVS